MAEYRRDDVYSSCPVTRPRLIACLLALGLAVPSSAFAQGAGNDQYQDPFGDEPAQSDGGTSGSSGEDGGLSNTPPGGGSGTSGTSGSEGSTGTSPDTTTTSPSTGTETAGTAQTLPNTGSDPRVLALFGMALLLFGVGLRLRTIDPDAY